MGRVGVGDMTKAVYDPNADGEIALAQLVAAVCSETEAKSFVTKEFFVPCSYSDIETQQLGDFPVIEVFTTGEAAWMVFKVPADFTSITSVRVIGIVKAVNENAALPMAIELLSDYGALDEAYTTHSEQDTYRLNEEGHATVNDLISWDAEGVLASLAAGDFVGIKALWEGASFLVHNETNASIIGLRFKYS